VAKVVFFSLPAYGHVNPALALVSEIVLRGHEVVFYSWRDFADSAETRGATFRPYRSPSLDKVAGFVETPGRTGFFVRFLASACFEILEGELQRTAAEEPTLIIHDSVAPWGKYLASHLDLPAVSFRPTFAFNRNVVALGWRSGYRPLGGVLGLAATLLHAAVASRLARRLARDYRLPNTGAVGLVTVDEALNIVCTSREFQPCADNFGDEYIFAGPVLEEGAAPVADMRDITSVAPSIYVSMGTVFAQDSDILRLCISALSDWDGQVIVSHGGAIDPQMMDSPAPNFVFHPFVQQLAVLEHARAFVCHGGIGSVSKALSMGVPAVVIPQVLEQAVVGERIEQLGAGVHLPRHTVTVERIRRAVERVTSDDGFRRAARDIAASFEASTGMGQAAERSLRYASTARRFLPPADPSVRAARARARQRS
jgi:MGT family glycosyltransferase